MANTFTTNYALTKPEVGSDTNAWGGHLNTDLDTLDTTLFAVSGVASAAMPKAGGTFTGAALFAVGAVGTPSISFTGDTDTGLYWISANSFALVANGAAVFTLAAGAATANGTFTCTGVATFNGVSTFNARVVTMASVTGGAGLNVPAGVAPTSPVNGDVWTTTTAQFNQINGATQQVAYISGVSSSIATLSTGVSSSLSSSTAGVSSSLSALSASLSAASLSNVSQTSSLSQISSSLSNANTSLANIASSQTGISSSLAGVATSLGSAASGTAAGSIGYLGTPLDHQNANYTLTQFDNGLTVYNDGGTTKTYTVPSLAAGTAIVVCAQSGNINLSQSGVTMCWAGTASTGNRTLTAFGLATLLWITTTVVMVSGAGLS